MRIQNGLKLESFSNKGTKWKNSEVRIIHSTIPLRGIVVSLFFFLIPRVNLEKISEPIGEFCGTGRGSGDPFAHMVKLKSFS